MPNNLVFGLSVRVIFLALFVFGCNAALARSAAGAMCTYAPSQSSKVAAIVSVAGASATAGAVSLATGLTAVAHSSGALILTGASGYIGGTMGATAAAVAAGPTVIVVGLVVGGVATSIELVCAAENHPKEIAKIRAAAEEFSRRFKTDIKRSTSAATGIGKSVAPASGRAALHLKHVFFGVWRHAYRKGSDGD
jgi:hypothetical protein